MDAGCGNGLYSLPLSRYFKKVYAFDLFEPNIVQLKNKINFEQIKNIEAFVGDVEKINLKDNIADLVLATEVLEHVYNPYEAINEFYRILKKEGVLIISVPYFKEAKEPEVPTNYKYDVNIFEEHKVEGYNEQVLKKILSDKGFKDIYFKYSLGFFARIGNVFM